MFYFNFLKGIYAGMKAAF